MAKAYEYVCPCKGCDKRELGCHEKCVLYKKWKKSGIEIVNQSIPYFDFNKVKRRRK